MGQVSRAKLLLGLLVLTGLASEALSQSDRRRRQAPDPGVEDPFDRVGPDVGQRAPDFVLRDLRGTEVHLAEGWSEGSFLLVLGSYTCPLFRERVKGSCGISSRTSPPSMDRRCSRLWARRSTR